MGLPHAGATLTIADAVSLTLVGAIGDSRRCDRRFSSVRSAILVDAISSSLVGAIMPTPVGAIWFTFVGIADQPTPRVRRCSEA